MTKFAANKDDNNLSMLAQEKNVLTLFSARELASYLHKSIRWIQIENSAGRLPQSLKIGSSRFWIAEDVATWLKSKREGR